MVELKIQSILFVSAMLEHPEKFQNIFSNHSKISRNEQKNEFIRDWLHEHNPRASLLVGRAENTSTDLERNLRNSIAFSHTEVSEYFDEHKGDKKAILSMLSQEMETMGYQEDDSISVITSEFPEEFFQKPCKNKPSVELKPKKQHCFFPGRLFHVHVSHDTIKGGSVGETSKETIVADSSGSRR